METITCRRCGEQAPRLERPPFRTELGERVQASICQDCWKDWLKHQTLLINENRLNPRDAATRAYLQGELEQYFFGSGSARPAGYVPQ